MALKVNFAGIEPDCSRQEDLEEPSPNALLVIASYEIHSEQIPTCNGRDLHAFLQPGRDFPTWISQRIKDYDFAKDVDFVVFPNSGENPRGGRPTKEYRLSLGMAKELCMVENSRQGRMARRYFIDCERRLLEQERAREGAVPVRTVPQSEDDYLTIGKDEYIALLKSRIELLEMRGVTTDRLRHSFEAHEQAAILGLAEQGFRAPTIARRTGRSESGIRAFLKRKGY